MRIEFSVPRTGPEGGSRNLLAEAAIYFDDTGAGPLLGMKLEGVSVWKSERGGQYCTFPARAFSVGGARKYWDYLRPVDPDGSAAAKSKVESVKAWVMEEYRSWATAQQAVPDRTRRVASGDAR